MFLEVSVAFPHLGIYIEDLKKSVNIFGIEVAFYGIIIADTHLMAVWHHINCTLSRGFKSCNF